MKYREIKNDEEILMGRSDREIAEIVNCQPSYIWMLRYYERTASWKFYKRLRKSLTASEGNDNIPTVNS